MKIAVLVEEDIVVEEIKNKIKDIFETTFYNNVVDLTDECYKYDIVLLSKKYANEETLSRLAKYEKLEICLLNDGKFENNNPRISMILNENQIENIAEELKYLETKIRIKTLVSIEEKTLEKIKHLTIKSDYIKESRKKTLEVLESITKQRFKFEIEENVPVIEIKTELSEFDVKTILNLIKDNGYRSAIHFSQYSTSMMLRSLIKLWKEINSRKGMLVYWNKNNNVKIESLLRLCKLDNILEITDSLDEVKLILKGD